MRREWARCESGCCAVSCTSPTIPRAEPSSDGRRSPCPLQRLSAWAWDERDALLRRMLRRVGEGVVVRALYCEYGAISIGDRTFVNVDAVMLDIAPITIGAACQIATRVQLLTATHPIDPEPRRLGWEYGEPIAIADNVWLGGGVIVCPGVTIGQDTVVGEGRWSHGPARRRRSGRCACPSPTRDRRTGSHRGPTTHRLTQCRFHAEGHRHLAHPARPLYRWAGAVPADRPLPDRRRRDRQPGAARSAGGDRELVRAPPGAPARRRPGGLGDGLLLRTAPPQHARCASCSACTPTSTPSRSSSSARTPR